MTLTRELLVVLGDPIVELVADAALGPAQPYQQRQGGDAVALALHASAAGRPTALLTRVGEDAFADWLIESWDAAGLHLDHAWRVAGRNGVRLRGAGEQGVWIDHRDAVPATAIDRPQCAAVPWDLTRYVFASGEYQALGGGAAEVLRMVFDIARQGGAKTIFHPALTSSLWPGGLHAAGEAYAALTGLVDVLVIGAPYASGRLLGQPEATRAVATALEQGVDRCVVIQPSGNVVFASADVNAGRVGTMEGWTEASLKTLVVALCNGDTLHAAVASAIER